MQMVDPIGGGGGGGGGAGIHQSNQCNNHATEAAAVHFRGAADRPTGSKWKVQCAHSASSAPDSCDHG